MTVRNAFEALATESTLAATLARLPALAAGRMPVDVVFPGTQAVSGPLTNTQLRAEALPVSFSWGGFTGLTNAELRSAPLQVQVSASPGLTDAELRATPVPVNGTVQVTGVVEIANDGGNALPVSATALPLPTGAATEASLALLAAATAIEDTPSPGGERGLVMLAQRRDADSAATDADGDYATLKMDQAGRLKVAAQPADYALVTGAIAAVNGQVDLDVRRVSNVMVQMVVPAAVAGHNVAFEGSLNSTNGTDGNWFPVQAVRSNTNTIESATGALAATPAYAWECSVNGVNRFRVRATAHTSGSANWFIQAAPYATEPIPAAQISGTQPVSLAALPALAVGANLAGDVGLQVRANATGAASIRHLVAAATTNPTNVKASAGRVMGWSFANPTASWRYVKLHNSAAAPTAGTGVVMTIAIPPNGLAQNSLPAGIGFTAGIGLTTVTGSADADATAVAAGDVVGDLFFA